MWIYPASWHKAENPLVGHGLNHQKWRSMWKSWENMGLKHQDTTAKVDGNLSRNYISLPFNGDIHGVKWPFSTGYLRLAVQGKFCMFMKCILGQMFFCHIGTGNVFRSIGLLGIKQIACMDPLKWTWMMYFPLRKVYPKSHRNWTPLEWTFGHNIILQLKKHVTHTKKGEGPFYVIYYNIIILHI